MVSRWEGPRSGSRVGEISNNNASERKVKIGLFLVFLTLSLMVVVF